MASPACQSSADSSAKARSGTWRDEPLCILQHALALCDDYTQKITECDAQIERQCAAMKPCFESEEPLTPLVWIKAGAKSQNKLSDSARADFMRPTAMYREAVTGISAAIAQLIMAELGTAMSRFPTVTHCCSWLGVCSHHDISGGRVLRARTLKVVHRTTQAFRQAVRSVARSHSAFGAYFRSIRARLGPEQATVATAHKIARVVYHLLKDRGAFQEKSAIEYEWERRERELKHLRRRAITLGYTLIPVAAAPPAPVV
jgi:transposase